VSARELQIKMAQGAKPGRRSVAGPQGRSTHRTFRIHAWCGFDFSAPHHDIYSIEDLSQLIYDLKNSIRERASV
jgi:glutamate synthase domain-containing protein 2